jgi:uncharacterized protein
MSAGLALGIVFAALIGVSLGIVGGGGSVVTVPLLVHVVGLDPHAAVGTSLAVVGATSFAGAAIHRRSGNVDLRASLLFAAGGSVAAFGGSRLTPLFSGPALMLTFGVLMIVVGLVMLRGSGGDSVEPRTAAPGRLLLAGGAVGLLTGVLGVGGGFLVVPALIWFGGLEMKRAIGSSLLVIGLNSAAGLAGHYATSRVDLAVALLLAVPAIGGTFGGAGLAGRFSNRALRRGFAVFVIAVGVAVAVARV